jgi:hypothetical protein
MYKAQQGEADASAGPQGETAEADSGAGGGEEEVVDAEFSEVDDEQKG